MKKLIFLISLFAVSTLNGGGFNKHDLLEDKIASRYYATDTQELPNATVCIMQFEDKEYDEPGTDNMQIGSGYTAATCSWTTPPRWTV